MCAREREKKIDREKERERERERERVTTLLGVEKLFLIYTNKEKN